MDLGRIITPTVPSMRENGLPTCRAVRVERLGQMAQFLRASTSKGRNKEKANSFGLIRQSTMGSSRTTTSMVRDHTRGQTNVSLWVNGKTTKCMVRGFSLGLMEKSTKVNQSNYFVRNVLRGQEGGFW